MTKRFGAFTALDDVSLKVTAGHVPRAARRERRRQEHARQMHHGLLPARRRPGAWSATSEQVDRQPARRARARHRHGLPALHAGAGMTVAENLVLARDDVPAVIDWARGAQGARGVSGAHAVPRAAQRQGVGDLGRREAEVRDPEAALSRAPLPDPRRADLGADAGRGRRGARHAARHGGGAAS